MKHKWIGILLCIEILCTLSGCTKPQPVETTEVSLLVGMEYSSNGSVLSSGQQKFTYNANGQMIERSKKMDSHWKTMCKFTYDTSGTPIRKVYFEPDGFLRYDKQGNLVLFRMDGMRDEYTYDENNNILSYKSVYDGKVTKQTYTYEYDDRGNLLLETSFFDDGRIRQVRYTYDDCGNVLTERRSGPEAYEENTTYLYDEAGRLVHRESISFSGSRESEHYIYDAQGRVFRYTYEFPEYTSRMEYDYSENGRFVTTKLYHNETLMSTTTTIYSPIEGKITSTTTEDMHTRILVKFNYDEKGNLILWEYTEEELLHNDKTDTEGVMFHYETVEIPVKFLEFVREEQQKLIDEFTLRSAHQAT